MRTLRGLRADSRTVRRSLMVALLLVSWVFASELVIGALVVSDANAVTAVVGWLFVVGSAGTAVYWMGRVAGASRRAERRALHANAALRSMELMTEAALTDLALDDLLDELLARIRHALDADGACLFLLDDDRGVLHARAAAGMEELVQDEVAIPVGTGIAGTIAATAAPLVVRDLREVYVHTPIVQERYRSLIGCPLFRDGEVVGVVYVVSTQLARFSEDRVGLLELVAERAAVAIERARLLDAERRSRLGADHARRHLTLLSRASDVLSRSLDQYKAAIAELGDVVVPSFADWFAVDLSGDGHPLRRLVGTHHAMSSADAMAVHRAHPRADDFIESMMGAGRSELTIDVSLASEADGESPRSHFIGEAAELGLTSLMVVPIRVRGLSFGAMTFGTAPGRRGYRPSDLVTAERLAERVTVAIERVLLYRDVQESASASEKLAGQLRRLMEASLTVNAPLSREEVAATVALQARRVVGAGRAVVTVRTPGGEDIVLASPATGATGATDVEQMAIEVVREQNTAHRSADAVSQWLAVPLTGFDGQYDGAIVVSDKHERSAEREAFGDDDHYLLVSLAQIAAVALRNSELYQSAQAREEHLQALVEAAPMGIVELGLDGGVQRWNRAAEEIFEWTLPIDEEWRAPALPTPLKPLFDELLASAHDGDAIAHREATVGMRQVHISSAPLKEGGAVTAMLAVVADVSEQRHLEEQLRHSQRMEAIGRLAGGVAHDFNNLLTVIIGYSDLVLPSITDERAREDLEAVKEAGTKAARLTEQLLAISRRQVLQPTLVDPNEVVSQMHEVLDRLIGEDVEITMELDESVGIVIVDRGHLEQVLLNLAVNARDAMPEGGRISLETSVVELSRSSPDFPGADPGTYLCVTVRDDGSGMDAATLERCFDPFFSTKPRDKGSGLGLATVYGIIHQSGGHIDASSTPGVGTVMRLVLPQVSWSGDDAAPLAGPFRLTGTEQVLLVEDEEPVRVLVRTALEARGYRVVEAANGVEALEAAGRLAEPVDLLLTDVVMPEMGGPELVDRLRAEHPTLRVLFISGYADAPGGAADLGPGARFLAKPFTPDELVGRVREALDEPEPERYGSKR